jgi:hypothetical protein
VRKLTLMAAILTAGFLYACSGGSPGSPVAANQPTSKQPVIQVLATGSVIDAATKATIPNATVTVTGATIANANGSPYLSPAVLNTSTGQVSFTMPTVTTDETLVLSAAADGYVPGTIKLDIKANGNNATNTYTFEIGLVSMSGATTDGVKNNKAPVSATAGKLDSTATVSAIVTAGVASPSATTVSIPAGTAVTAGNSQLTGPLTLSATCYSPLNADSLILFPSGMTDVTVGTTPTSFISAGYTEIQVIGSDGKVGTSLGNNPMTVRMDLAATAFNPETNSPVKAGDSINVWTYHPSTDTWVVEKGGPWTVQSDAKGLFVTFTADHLSSWNLGWPPPYTCKGVLKLTGDISSSIKLVAVLDSPYTGTLLSANSIPNDPNVVVNNIPRKGSGLASMPMTITAYYGSPGVVVGGPKDITVDWCTNPQTLNIALPSTLKAYTFTVTRKCMYGDKETSPVQNSSVYACSNSSAASYNDSSCRLVALSGANGAVTVQTYPNYKLFFVYPDSGCAPLSTTPAISYITPVTPVPNVSIQFEGNFTCCRITGGQ